MTAPDRISRSTLVTSSVIDELDTFRQSLGIKGCSAVIVKKNNMTGQWERQYIGLALRDAKGDPVEKDVGPAIFSLRRLLDKLKGLGLHDQSIYAIASISEHFTAITLHLAFVKYNKAQEGKEGFKKLSYDSKVKEVLPDFKLIDEVATERATFVDLMGECCRLATECQCVLS